MCNATYLCLLYCINPFTVKMASFKRQMVMLFLCTLISIHIKMYSPNDTCVNNVAHELSITSWNMRGMNTAYAYLSKLMNQNDIVVINEHWLAEHELYKLNYVSPSFYATGKAGHSVNKNTAHAWGGVGLLWRKTIDCNIKVLDNVSRRICGVCFNRENEQKLYIFGVYLPHSGCSDDDFENELVVLEEEIRKYSQLGEIIIIGDCNCHFGADIGNRGWGKTTKHALMLLNVIRRNALTIVDLHEIGKGPTYTFYSNRAKSYIDHCILSDTIVMSVSECRVLDECIQNTSDHLPIQVKIRLNNTLQRYLTL